MNELIAGRGNGSQPAAATEGGPAPSKPMRSIESLVINPSEDLAIVARQLSHRMPRLVRYLMEGLGSPDAQSADLMSYLLFDSRFTSALVDIGYRDAGARIDAIEAFLAADQIAAAGPGRAVAGAVQPTSPGARGN